MTEAPSGSRSDGAGRRVDCTRPPANGHGVHLVGGVQHRRSNSYGVRRQSAQQGDPLVDM
eukprot:scaffold143585_cov127-Phaeocystis_antarctica.AAC.3